MADLHDDENRGKDACESNPGQYSQLPQCPDTRQYSSGNCGNHRPHNGAPFAVGEDFEALGQANKSGTGRQATCLHRVSGTDLSRPRLESAGVEV